MKEIWKDIEDYKGYQVSNLGRVRTFNKITYSKLHGERHWKDRILKEANDKKNKMLSVCLYKNGKQKRYLIHRLVAETFLGKQKNMTVNHKDGNRYNNKLDNLEWLSLKDNIKHAWENNLIKTNKYVKIINKNNNYDKTFRSMSEASKAIGKNHGYISSKIKRKIYEDKNFKWSLL